MNPVSFASPSATISPSSAWKGLTSQEAQELLDRFGPNDPTPVRHGAALTELLFLFLNPLVIILLVAALVSFLLGDTVDAAIIVLIVLLSVTINFVQTYRSQQAIRKLRENVTPTATVMRDAQWQEIKRREIVPGDFVRLSAGDLIPADGKLLEARNLYVQQAALTGESLPVEKGARLNSGEREGTPEAHDSVFLGTSVVSGTAIAKITATGAHTSFGAIAERPELRRESEVDRGISVPQWGFIG